MHIKLLYRKVLYVFLSVMIVIAPTIQQANAASSWSVTNAVNAGSRVIVTATKGGYKSAVNIAPSAARIGLKLAKGANWAALVYAAIQLAPDIADIKSFQPDYANGNVKYKEKSSLTGNFHVNHGYKADTPLKSCQLWLAANGGGVSSVVFYDFANRCTYKDGSIGAAVSGAYVETIVNKTMPINTIIPKLLSNAAVGHSDTQKLYKETAIEMVVTGDFDKDLLAGAVPTTDTKPLIPAVPISGNGNVAVGDTDSGMTGGDVGKAADDARKAADDARKSAQAAADVYKDAVESARKAAEEAESVINSAVDQAIKDAAKAAADVAAKSAADAKAVADRAAQAALEAAKSSERASQAAAQAAQGIADGAKAALEAAKAAANATAESIAQAQAVADSAIAAADKAMEAAKAAEKAAEKAKAEAAKPFELPAFCTWASVVCDYTVWVKEEYGNMSRWLKEEPTATPAEMMPIDDDPAGLGGIFQDKAEAGYVSFESSCPVDVLIPIDLMGASQVLNISYTPFCHFASMIRYAVILGAWISGLLIVTGGRSRE